MDLHELMDLKIDYAFKQLFGNPKNSRILITFLNAMLERTETEPITSVSFENTELSAEHPEDKKSRLDIMATTNDQRKINIEIQFTDKHDMINRTLYYWSRIYGGQMQAGQSYKDLHQTIVINILNYNLLRKETDKFHTTFHLHEDEEQFRLTETMEVHFVEMRKLLVKWKRQQLNPHEDLLVRWLLLLGAVDSKNKTAYEDIYRELEVIAMKDEVLREAFASWETLSRDKRAREAYEVRLKEILDEAAVEREQELRLKEAREQGEIKGRKEGRADANREHAVKMLEKGADLEFIKEITGLSKEEIEELGGQTPE